MRSPETKQFVAVVGGAGSGKDTVASIFAAHGFTHVSSSDLVRAEIARRNLRTSRELQTHVANECRQRYGHGYWVDAAIELFPADSERNVISGLYAPGEGSHFLNKYNGVIVAVVADADDPLARLERIRARASGARDELDAEAFLAAEARENSGTTLAEANLSALLRMAQHTIVNSGSLQDLELSAVNTIHNLGKVAA